MYKRSQFEKYKQASSLNQLMTRLNSQNTPPKFIQDILNSDEGNQSDSRKLVSRMKALIQSGSKSLDPNRRKIIDKKTLQNEYYKFLSQTVDQNGNEKEKVSLTQQIFGEKICLSKIIGKKYQVFSPF